jgi:hypothetical protein
MSNFMTVAKSWLWLIVKIACIAGFCYWVGGMPLRYSIVLAVLIPFPSSKEKEEAQLRFTPYQLILTPHIGAMLLDLGLITTERWAELRDNWTEQGKKWSGHDLPFTGLYANVLSVDADGDELAHWMQPNLYLTGLSFRETLPFLTFPGQYTGWSPSFFFRPSMKGYAIGIEVREEWWKENKERLLNKGVVKDVSIEYNFGTVLLFLQHLPARTLAPFYIGWSQKLVDEAKKEAIALGWKSESLGSAEVGYHGEQYEADYATVWIRTIPEAR